MKINDPKAFDACRKNMMKEQEYDDMCLIFTEFADSTRLKIMNALFTSELCVTDLAVLLEMSHSSISHQLASLKKTKLVRSRKIGKMVYYSMADTHIKNIYKMAYDHTKE